MKLVSSPAGPFKRRLSFNGRLMAGCLSEGYRLLVVRGGISGSAADPNYPSGDQEAGAGSGFCRFIVSLFSSPHKEKQSEQYPLVFSTMSQGLGIH
ncbi:hypothetical protein TSUD_198790 [Trifolium subterraneum]|uniref:Uncharacterized protein n=1 Tax=Trifolium subterraneum TaxID=3900 RepID=A0A2Z6LR46_TRISU|nr:hypothetical protein TSUD_198790 [Trifolium subterraneum]